MKKVLLFFVALLATLGMNAQTTEIYKGTAKEATYSGADVRVEFGTSGSDRTIKVYQGADLKGTYTGSDYKVVSKELPPSTGEALRKPGTSVKWVQLWKDGPKFAEYNIGANTATDYGYYLAWGGNDDKNTAYNAGSTDLSGSDDSAYAFWGLNWRMPTIAEINGLQDQENCSTTWYDGQTKKYNDTTVPGYLITGKGDYSSNSIFLPAAGSYVEGKVSNLGTIGRYWCSTLDPSTPDGIAGQLYIDDDEFWSAACDRTFGCSVRPIYVADEDLVAVTGVSLRAELKVGTGNTETLSATVAPENATNKKVSWETSDETVATVDKYGKVTGVGTGECVIKATTEDGEKTATCTVKVVVPTTGYAKATINGKSVDVKWIQLWKDGPKFAEFNVGVTDGKKTSIGEYYAWTDIDIATSVWGSNWRMPTIAELQGLLDNCYCAWYNSGSYLGCNGRGDYATNSIDLPKSGYKHPGMTGLQNSSYIFYWSSTPDSPGNAKMLQGVPGLEQEFGPAWTDETSGVEGKLCVRAVLNESK